MKNQRLPILALLLALLVVAGCKLGDSQATATPKLLPTSGTTATLHPTVTMEPATAAPTAAVATTVAPTVAPATAAPTAAATATEMATATPTETPTPAPTATPLPLPEGELEHLSNIGPYLLTPPEAGQPTHELLKDGHMRAWFAINPAHWAAADALPNMEGYGRNYMDEQEELSFIRRREQGARGYYDRFRPTYEQARGNVHAWMSTWAFVYGDKGFAEDWVAFQREWLRLMHADGYLAGVGGMKSYPFKAGEFAWLAPAIAEADYVFLGESDAPTLMTGAGHTTFRYRELYAELQAALGEQPAPELILDVCVDGAVLVALDAPGGPHWQRGYRDYNISPEAYAADVRAYDISTLFDPYVRHVFWFATNISEDTRSFDVNTPMLELADSWHVAAETP
ncbi:MAG: hypothetical protein ACOX2L_11520 [Anaerolineae bacterium]|nr:hypothetical protein [Chloroflexota bacterium]